MNVQELIDKLDKISNKQLPIIIYDEYNGSELVPQRANNIEVRNGTSVVIYSQNY